MRSQKLPTTIWNRASNGMHIHLYGRLRTLAKTHFLLPVAFEYGYLREQATTRRHNFVAPLIPSEFSKGCWNKTIHGYKSDKCSEKDSIYRNLHAAANCCHETGGQMHWHDREWAQRRFSRHKWTSWLFVLVVCCAAQALCASGWRMPPMNIIYMSDDIGFYLIVRALTKCVVD